MLLGVISDTHDNLSAIDKALAIFKERQVELVVHCGDFVSPFTVAHFSQKAQEMNLPVKAVFGNNEGDKGEILKTQEHLNTTIEFPTKDEFLTFEMDDAHFAIYHGHHFNILEMLVSSGIYQAVFTGHTHQAGIEEQGKCQVINPGACCGIVKGVYLGKGSIGIYNTLTKEFEVISFDL